MDALKTQRAMIRALLWSQPGRAVFCALIAVLGLAVAWLEPSDFRDILAPSLVALSMIAFLAIAAPRLDACCRSAGALGVPLHLEHARHTQIVLLVMFVASPAIYLLAMGFGWNGLSAAFAAGFVGVNLFRNSWLAWLIIGLWLASRMGFDVWSFASHAKGSLVIVALAIVSFVAWWRNLPRTHEQGSLEMAALADSRHEAQDMPRAPSGVEELLAGAGRRLTPRMFWGALGYESTANWRKTVLLVLGALGIFVAMHAYRHGRADAGIFLIASVLAGLLAGWRFFALQGAWATSSNEQSVLVLTPRWPGRRALKWLVIRTFWTQVPASLVAWVMLAATGLLAGWLSTAVVVRGATQMLSIAFALFGFLLLFLAKQRLRKQNWTVMGYLVVTGLAGLLLIVTHGRTTAWRVLCVVMVVPAALALLAFLLRRPQFPARPDADLAL